MEEETRKCEYCGKEYKTTCNHQIYCSKKCKIEEKNRRAREKYWNKKEVELNMYKKTFSQNVERYKQNILTKYRMMYERKEIGIEDINALEISIYNYKHEWR